MICSIFLSYTFFIQLTLVVNGLSYNHRQLNMLSTSLKNKRVIIVGATGYIGKFVVKESVNRGYDTIAVVRSGSKQNDEYLKGATIVNGDVTDIDSLKQNVFTSPTDVVISCLASRSGVKSDSFLIDYQATLNTLNAAKSSGLDQFILLSAFCVRKPTLQFQLAKLKFEEALQQAQKDNEVKKFSIVRPTAFFKSVSGQFELLQQGMMYIVTLLLRCLIYRIHIIRPIDR